MFIKCIDDKKKNFTDQLFFSHMRKMAEQLILQQTFLFPKMRRKMLLKQTWFCN